VFIVRARIIQVQKALFDVFGKITIEVHVTLGDISITDKVHKGYLLSTRMFMNHVFLVLLEALRCI